MEGLAQRLEALERENAELREEVAELRSVYARRDTLPRCGRRGMHRYEGSAPQISVESNEQQEDV